MALPACAKIPGCSDGKRPIVYIDVSDKASQSPEAPTELKKRALEEATRDAIPLLGDYAFRHKKKEEVAWQISVAVRMTTERTADPKEGQAPDPTKVRRAVGLSMALFSVGSIDGKKARYETDVLQTEVVPRSEPFEAVATRTIRKGVEQIRATIQLEEASDQVLIEKLSAKDEQLRARAVVMAGQKKIKAAVPKLEKMLKDKDEAEDIIIKVIGSLIEIGNPDSAGALIDAGRNRSPLYLSQIIFGLARLGGKEAEAYLFTVASGHPDPMLRKNAKDALEELERKRVPPPSP